MENFINYIQDSIKTIENMELTHIQKSLAVSRLDSICAILSITIYNLNEKKDEKSQNE